MDKTIYSSITKCQSGKDKEGEAVCVLQNSQGRKMGIVHFKELSSSKTQISVSIEGLSPGLHGFHIHKTGNLVLGCKSLCEHYNPFNEVHGDIKSNKRHVGDMGNIKASSTGKVNTKFTDHLIRVTGPYSILGRSVIVHADPDDLGKGGNEESLKTGNSGKRVLCGVIGRL